MARVDVYHNHLNFDPIPKPKHQLLISVHGYVVDRGVPEGEVELKLKSVKLGDGEKETAHNICLEEPTLHHFKIYAFYNFNLSSGTNCKHDTLLNRDR